MSTLLNRVIQRADDILVCIELAVLVCPSLEILPESTARDSHVVSVDQLVLEQECEDFCMTKIEVKLDETRSVAYPRAGPGEREKDEEWQKGP